MIDWAAMKIVDWQPIGHFISFATVSYVTRCFLWDWVDLLWNKAEHHRRHKRASCDPDVLSGGTGEEYNI